MSGLPAYTTAKGGMNALTRYVAAEHGKKGIRCNAIIPGILANEANAAVVNIPQLKAAIEDLHLGPCSTTPTVRYILGFPDAAIGAF
jgi:NAD(P)-dependent dehydrogenase (short-subunit alcohol dehydrogenase family)